MSGSGGGPDAGGAIDPGWARGGFRVYGGTGPTRADLDDLATMTRTLATAAARLDAAAAALRTAAWLCQTEQWQAPAAAHAAHEACTLAGLGVHGPAAVADRVRDLATRVRRAIDHYDGAESFVSRLVRTGVAHAAAGLGEVPLLGAGLVAAAGAVTALGVGQAVVTSPLRRAVCGGDDPLLDALTGFVTPLDSLPGRLAADGRGTWEVTAAAAFLHAALSPGLQVPLLADPVAAAAGDLTRVLPDAAPTALIARTEAPRLPAPRTTADVLATVRATYAAANGGAPGTPTGTITVQRLTHPDGSVGWLVAVPGTQAWRPVAAAPTDLTTNLQEIGGAADDMTTATVEAMRLAGMQPGDRVLVAGHSQGGMTALHVATAVAGYYDVRAVLTAGSPDVPGAVPAGVQVRAYRHTQDVVPQLDGRPDVGGPQVSVVTRDLAATGGPADPTVAQAHSIDEYATTARLADGQLAGSPALRAYDDAQAQVLGPEGTTATTVQFQATRDPVLAATNPETGLPLPPRIEPVYPAAGRAGSG